MQQEIYQEEVVSTEEQYSNSLMAVVTNPFISPLLYTTISTDVEH